MRIMIGSGGGGMWHSMGMGDDENRPEPNIDRKLLRRVASYGRPYARQIVFILFAIALTSLLGLIPPLVYLRLIDITLPQSNASELNFLVVVMIAIPVSTGLIGVAQRYFSAKMGEGLICDLRQALYGHIQRMSLRFFTHTKTGEIMARLNSDVVGAQRAITGTLINIITNIFQLVFTLGIMLSLEWRLTLVGLVILPILILPARRVGKILRKITRESMDLNAQMSALMNETLNVSGALLMKIFGRESQMYDRFRERSEKVRDIGVRSAIIGRWFFLGIGLLSAVATAVVYWLGGHLVFEGVFTIGAIIAFASYLVQLYGPIQSLTTAHVDFATSMVSFERVFEVLDLPIEIDDKPDAVVLNDVKGRVQFENVSFSYLEGATDGKPVFNADAQQIDGDVVKVDGDVSMSDHTKFKGPHGGGKVMMMKGKAPAGDGEQTQASRVVRLESQERMWGRRRDMGMSGEVPEYAPSSSRRLALQDISFEIEPGQLAALVGPSGAGKTTVSYLLPRLYDPSEGRIMIEGHDLRDVALGSLTEQIGMVTQETYLFHDTIRENLLYAKLDATQAELDEACRMANIYDFIAKLPEGYDTVVGERGYRLSGGEKQRVALARVILKDPRILVLDEATSSLDSLSESLIQDALKTVFEGRTSLVIAHRLSTILAADLILVFDEGRLIEKGSHEELLKKDGLYTKLYNTQFRRLEDRSTAT